MYLYSCIYIFFVFIYYSTIFRYLFYISEAVKQKILILYNIVTLLLLLYIRLHPYVYNNQHSNKSEVIVVIY